GATHTVTPTQTTTYTVTVTDANGCEDSDEVTITVNPSPSVTVEDDEACEMTAYDFTAVASGGTPPYSYQWNTGDTTVSIQDMAHTSGIFIVTVTDANGCSAVDTANLTVYLPPVVSLEKTNASCGMSNGTATSTVTGGQPPYEYLWSNSSDDPHLTDVPSGSYQLTVTDANGCIGEASILIGDDDGPIVTASDDAPICKGGITVISATATAGTPPYSYSWDQGIGAGDVHTVSPTGTTTYTVTVTDANGCQSMDDVTITVHSNPIIVLDPASGPSCSEDLQSWIAEFSVLGGTVTVSSGVLISLGNNEYEVIDIPLTDTLIVTNTSDADCETTATFYPPECVCPEIEGPTGVEAVYACDDKPVPTLVVFVAAGLTADWYDAPVNGNLLAAGTTSYQPAAAGIFWVEARDPVTDCVSERLRIEVIPVDCKDCPTPDCLELEINR
ncbi:MAG: hypothetical protein GY751_08450, partial [Bacteroidetes bacterium]|nr:hypothetical protein [Bacteroidota bacterium]